MSRFNAKQAILLHFYRILSSIYNSLNLVLKSSIKTGEKVFIVILFDTGVLTVLVPIAM